jgi:hypothetical protein
MPEKKNKLIRNIDTTLWQKMRVECAKSQVTATVWLTEAIMDKLAKKRG